MTSSRADTMNGFIITMFLVHLCQTGVIHFNMSCYDMFCFALRSIKSTNWNDGVFMKQNENKDEKNKGDVKVDQELKANYRNAFPVVFIDPSGKTKTFSLFVSLLLFFVFLFCFFPFLVHCCPILFVFYCLLFLPLLFPFFNFFLFSLFFHVACFGFSLLYFFRFFSDDLLRPIKFDFQNDKKFIC